jgi:hypothetical protein
MIASTTLNDFPPPRSTSEIREQLAALNKVKTQALAYGTPDFASQVGMQSILRHEQELLEELRAAELLESNNATRFAAHTGKRGD